MKTVKIHFLNTIWSDVSILEVDNHYGMIDTGSSFYFPMIQEYLKENNINHLDFVFLSHFHSDHYGNMINVLTNYKVDKVYFRNYSRHEAISGDGSITDEEYINNQIKIEEEIKECVIKHSTKLVIIDESLEYIELNGLKLYLFNQLDIVNYLYNKEDSLFYQKNTLSENHMTIPLYFEYLNHHVYFGGDLTDNDSKEQLVRYQNLRVLLNIKKRFNFDHLDIYKTTHHGGGGSNNPATFILTKPDYAIITNTNRWLDNWSTRSNILLGSPSCNICQTDYYQYVFDLSNKQITCRYIPKESLFITLNKD